MNLSNCLVKYFELRKSTILAHSLAPHLTLFCLVGFITIENNLKDIKQKFPFSAFFSFRFHLFDSWMFFLYEQTTWKEISLLLLNVIEQGWIKNHQRGKKDMFSKNGKSEISLLAKRRQNELYKIVRVEDIRKMFLKLFFLLCLFLLSHQPQNIQILQPKEA